MFIDKQAIIKYGDTIGGGQFVRNDSDFTIGLAHAHPGAHHLGGVHIASGIKSDIIRSGNRPTVLGDDLQLTRRRINGRYLTTHGLGNVKPAIGAELHAIGTK